MPLNAVQRHRKWKPKKHTKMFVCFRGHWYNLSFRIETTSYFFLWRYFFIFFRYIIWVKLNKRRQNFVITMKNTRFRFRSEGLEVYHRFLFRENMYIIFFSRHDFSDFILCICTFIATFRQSYICLCQTYVDVYWIFDFLRDCGCVLQDHLCLC